MGRTSKTSDDDILVWENPNPNQKIIEKLKEFIKKNPDAPLTKGDCKRMGINMDDPKSKDFLPIFPAYNDRYGHEYYNPKELLDYFSNIEVREKHWEEWNKIIRESAKEE